MIDLPKTLKNANKKTDKVWEGEFIKGDEETLEDDGYIHHLIVVMVSWSLYI